MSSLSRAGGGFLLAPMGIFATIDLVPAADEAPASVLLRPKENLLVLEVLHYRHQVTQPAALASEAPQTEVAPEELKMAKTLVNASTGDFTLDKYPDLYTRKLQQLIEAKVAGKEIVAAPASEGPQVINLMEALKQSVARVQGTNSARKESRKSTRRLVRKIS